MDKISRGLVALTPEQVGMYLPVIIEKGIPLSRKKNNGEFSYIPAADFDRYLGNREVTFYIDGSSLSLIEQSFKNGPVNEDIRASGSGHYSETDKVFAGRLKEAGDMDRTERLQAIMNNVFKINEFIQKESGISSGTLTELGELFAQTICINKASFEENLSESVEGDHLKKIVSNTVLLIDGFVNLIQKGKVSYRDLARLSYIQTGSVSLNHMNRILVRFTAFLFFYNSYFQSHSLEVKRFRSNFAKIYFPYYDRIVSQRQRITLETVFKGGLSPVSERSAFVEYCMGGFFHDIGKFPEIEYHDSGLAYDVKKASRHVFDGYNMLMNSNQVSYGIVSVGLLHHDYYGAPYGYRQTDTLRKKIRPGRNVTSDYARGAGVYLISKNIMDVADGTAMSYFPCKIMEILDIYDAMTDSDKKYRDGARSPEEALYAIRGNYLDRDRPGIDPIIFNIFVDFLQASAVIMQDAARGVKIGV